MLCRQFAIYAEYHSLQVRPNAPRTIGWESRLVHIPAVRVIDSFMCIAMLGQVVFLYILLWLSIGNALRIGRGNEGRLVYLPTLPAQDILYIESHLAISWSVTMLLIIQENGEMLSISRKIFQKFWVDLILITGGYWDNKIPPMELVSYQDFRLMFPLCT